MGSRFVGLSVGDFGPNEPGPSGTQPPASPVPQTQEPTRPTSPTPTLQPYVGPTTWTWGETEYDTLEEAILASMTEHDMPEKLRGWYISVVRNLTRREIVDLYNLLGNKMYEHRACHDRTSGTLLFSPLIVLCLSFSRAQPRSRARLPLLFS